MAETAPITMIRGDENLINTTEIVDGQILFDETNRCVWVDDGDVRIKYSGIGSDANIATVEKGSTATEAFSIDNYVIVGNVLYRVIKAIAVGDSFTVGTNIIKTTVGDEIHNITASTISYNDSTTKLGSTTVQGAIEKLDSRLDETDTSISEINTHLTSTDTNLTKLNNKTRRTRNNITSNLGNLTKATAEQDLEKYGYSIGDYFTGASGYTYHIADMDTYYGGYNNNAVVSTHHIGIVVDTKASSAWLSSGTASSYSASTLHTYLKGTALTNIKNDFTTLFGSSSHLLAHTELDNGPGGWGTTWTGLANTQICALSEVQVYGSRIFGMDGYQSGTACRCLEIFHKFRFNEILGNKWWWLRSLSSSSVACDAYGSGRAYYDGLSGSRGVVGLILFY